MDSQPGPSNISKWVDRRPLTKKDLEEEIRKIMEEESDDNEIPPTESDSEVDHISVSDHLTDTDADEPSEDEGNFYESSLAGTPSSHFYLGKDGTRWSKQHPPINVRTRAHNLVTHLPGPKGKAKDATTPFEGWNCMISDNMINHIVRYTNIYIDLSRGKFVRERDAAPTDQREMKALFGLLYYAGVLKSGRLNTLELWEKHGSGVDIFPAVMSRKRFLFLLTSLRFDDIRDRHTRRQSDKLAPIRELSELFKNNIQSSYVISEYATIDEKLEPFRGRCSFRQYIKSKPARYGIKIFLLTDSRTYYTNNFEIYAGKQPEGEYKLQNDPYSVVCRLIKPIEKTGRNITMDNWFMSIKLMNDLLKNHRLTCVGTIRKNKREVPTAFVTPKNRSEYSSLFAFSENKTVVSYCPKKGKVVLVGSTMHNDDCINSESEKQKPEIIEFYNLTKGGVDTVDTVEYNPHNYVDYILYPGGRKGGH
ncbi:piggyBac transposable element-derived protein 4-like [Onthophagus taurus]|uniref:piggyBac transposable element-derived protein 4-like n=1 Tax=Onthophagus taurus TaxID=166361 RepID=UPI0039BDDB26